jgi:hypothetical protein
MLKVLFQDSCGISLGYVSFQGLKILIGKRFLDNIHAFQCIKRLAFELVLEVILFDLGTKTGIFFMLQEMVVRPGLELRPWRGLILSGGFALVVFGAISVLMKRSLQPTASATAGEGTR